MERNATVKLYSLGWREMRTYMFALLFIVGNIVLPQLCHLFPKGGLIMLPIYFFTLIAAYKFGFRVGLLTAVLSPLINSVLFGMPPAAALPIIMIKGVLLAGALDGVASCLIFMRLRFTREGNRCCCSLGNGKLPNPLVALIFPRTLDESCSRLILGIKMAQTLVGERLHDDVSETRLSSVGSDTCHGFPNPLADSTIGIVVETVHALRSHAFFNHVAVPSFPNGRCTIVH